MKRSIDWKVKDIEAGYDILLSRLEADYPDNIQLSNTIKTAVNTHMEISRRIVELLGATPNPLNEPGAAPARTARDEVKLKKGLKPTTLTLDFKPKEFQAWQNKFKIYYRTSRMNTAEKRGYFYSCISEHLKAVILRNTPAGANIFREEGQQDKACFDELVKEFSKK